MPILLRSSVHNFNSLDRPEPLALLFLLLSAQGILSRIGSVDVKHRTMYPSAIPTISPNQDQIPV